MNEEEIIYLTVQLRQLENLRNISKKPKEKESYTIGIRSLKAQLDPLLDKYIDFKKKTPMAVDKSNEDLGPKDVVAAIHAWAQMKLSQEEAVNWLSNQPVSVAGQYKEFVYLAHFERK